ncbi:hypothetical protein ABIB40_000671 [Pedobacter sp. UYP30]|uniref:PKD domain-containing protein n=1 Tax=Pedobacter sp. UYP30 TaxID=1756400 RepID=UPI0033961A25
MKNEGKAVDTNRQNYALLYVIGGIVLIAALIFLFRSSIFDSRTINASILKDEMSVNEPLVYADNTKNAKKWLWEFGNGAKSDKQDGTYKFNKAGAYIVRVTVDGELQQQFPINILEKPVAVAIDSTITINGPTQGIVNEQVRLEAQGNARIYNWSFGETGRVDVKGPTAFYTFQIPGTYLVKLETETSTKPIYHKILITSPDSSYYNIVDPGQGEREMVDDIKVNLQAIANGADFNTHYYYLVRKYFCGDEDVSVSIEADGTKKQSNLYSYCMRLTFGGGTIVDDAKVSLKPKSKCAGALNVKQHSTKHQQP